MSLYFDEALNLYSVPDSSAFQVVVEGLNTTVTGVVLAVPRVTGTVRLTLSPPRPSNDWWRVTYTPPDTNPLKDTAGNRVAANGHTSRSIDQAFSAADTSEFSGSVRCDAVGRARFTAIALQMDSGTRIFTTLPVMEVEERMSQE